MAEHHECAIMNMNVHVHVVGIQCTIHTVSTFTCDSVKEIKKKLEL